MPFPRTRDLRWIAPVLLAIWGSAAQGAGLGSIEVRSGLGQGLRVSIPLLGPDAKDVLGGSHCVKARVETIDGALVANPRINLTRTKDGASIELRTHQGINELALNISVNVGCTLSVHRTYQILLDPVLTLPSLQESQAAEDAAASRPLALPMQENTAQVAANPSPSGDRKRNSPSRRKAESNSAPAVETDAIQVPSFDKPKSSRRLKEKKATRSVLRLSSASDDAPVEESNPNLGLKLSDTLSFSRTASDPETLAQLRADQAKLLAMLRGEDAGASAERKMKSVQEQLQALQAETMRLKQQGQADKAVLEAEQHELLNWIGSLGGLLLTCFAALAWLAWRLYEVRRSNARASWNRLLEDHDINMADSITGVPDSEFNSTAFYNSAFNNTEFDNPSTSADTTSPGKLELDSEPGLNTIQREKTERLAALRQAPVSKELPEFRYANSASKPFVFVNRTDTARVDTSEMQTAQSVKADEISDVMQLAEAWMALQDPERVLEILEPFRDVEQPESPLPWICLLDVYRALHDQEKYEAIHGRITRIFNVKLAPWDDSDFDDDPLQTLADFPHIIKNILNLWDGDDIVPYLESLLVDNRDGTRKGFTLTVYRSIMQLITMASDPHRSKRIDQIMHDKAYAILFNPREVKKAVVKKPEPAPAAKKPVAREKPQPVPDKVNISDYEKTPASTGPVRTASVEVRTSGQAASPATGGDTATAVQNPPVQKPAPTAGKPPAQDKPHTAPAKPAAPKPAPPVRIEPTLDSSPASEQPKQTAYYEEMSPMTIKLHLAIAYQDIGDREGARMLLEEVVKEGNADQTAQARLMLSTLD